MKAPTDLEWMMFHDGELPEPRRSELASLLEVEELPAQKLRGLDVLGALVRAEPQPTVDLADVIMSRIASEAPPNGKVVPLRPKQAVGDAEAVTTGKAPTVGTAPASNDNGRLLFGLTGLAAAAAVGLFVWGGAEPGPTAPSEPLAQVGEPAPLPVAAAKERPSTTAREVAPVVEESGLPPVEVASVDFGSRSGAVIYMDEPKGATTTVVWLTDE